MTVPAALIGRSFFCVKHGMMCGLHLKSTTTVALSVTQEPLRVALGTFRAEQLGELTQSAASHVPSLLQAIVAAFESGAGVELVNPASADLVARMDDVTMGHSVKKRGSQRSDNAAADAPPPPATGVRVRFAVFGSEYDLTLNVKPCPDDAKDPFVWTLLMDLYRAMMRGSRHEVSPPRPRTGLTPAVASAAPPSGKRDPAAAPPAAAAATTPRAQTCRGTRVPPGEATLLKGGASMSGRRWRGVNTSRGHGAHDVGTQLAVEKQRAAHAAEAGAAVRRTWETACQTRSELQQQLLAAQLHIRSLELSLVEQQRQQPENVERHTPHDTDDLATSPREHAASTAAVATTNTTLPEPEQPRRQPARPSDGRRSKRNPRLAVPLPTAVLGEEAVRPSFHRPTHMYD